MVLALDDSSTRRRSLSANETAYTGAIAGAEGLSAVKSRVNRLFSILNMKKVLKSVDF